MLCAISGEAPQLPVVSTKSGISPFFPILTTTLTLTQGNIFEKRLIEAYISENGKDPITNEELSTDELVELKTARTVKPRPPTLTSIPSLLAVFQNEWDALALETFTLRQHLTQTRQELSHALYENDAAKRVIARLSKERDEARGTLSNISVGRGASNGDAMQLDGQELSPALVAKVEATQEKLSKTRRKRPLPDDWVTPDAIETFAPTEKSNVLYPGARSIAVDASGDKALFGGSDGAAGVYSLSQKKLMQELTVGDPVTDAVWVGDTAVIATSAGKVKSFEGGTEIFSFSAHAGAVTALALHPSGDILASVGIDKTYVFYDLSGPTKGLQVSTNSALTTAQFHPDGHLFAAGGMDGQIKVFDVKNGANAANFDEAGPIQALHFSENGTWLAVAVKESTSVSIWDLRKSAQVKLLEIRDPVVNLRWDYTGQFLAAAGPAGLTIQYYQKASKMWSEPLRTAVPAAGLDWGSKAQSLVTVNDNGVVTVLEAR
ncbi:MAG: hypothetical protein Q9217_000340 [Psora testacea]